MLENSNSLLFNNLLVIQFLNSQFSILNSHSLWISVNYLIPVVTPQKALPTGTGEIVIGLLHQRTIYWRVNLVKWLSQTLFLALWTHNIKQKRFQSHLKS